MDSKTWLPDVYYNLLLVFFYISLFSRHDDMVLAICNGVFHMGFSLCFSGVVDIVHLLIM